MPDVLIRNIDNKTIEKLKSRAEKNNRSLQGELHEMLKDYINTDIEETRKMVNEILEEYKIKDRIFSDSVDDIREDRDR